MSWKQSFGAWSRLGFALVNGWGNYFPTKEDLFFGGLDQFEEQLLDAIRSRDPDETALMAFGRFVLQPRGLLGAKDPESIKQLASITRVIDASPALLLREQQIFAGLTDSLAALLAAEQGSAREAIKPWVTANALMGVHRALVAYTRCRIVAGARNPKLARDVQAQGRSALAALEQGFAVTRSSSFGALLSVPADASASSTARQGAQGDGAGARPLAPSPKLTVWTR